MKETELILKSQKVKLKIEGGYKPKIITLFLVCVQFFFGCLSHNSNTQRRTTRKQETMLLEKEYKTRVQPICNEMNAGAYGGC